MAERFRAAPVAPSTDRGTTSFESPHGQFVVLYVRLLIIRQPRHDPPRVCESRSGRIDRRPAGRRSVCRTRSTSAYGDRLCNKWCDWVLDPRADEQAMQDPALRVAATAEQIWASRAVIE
uniref:Uncharacterized protein n=1 Tax=Rhodococcus sp. NS1 TaxID=402236 RepID=A0A097SQ50_9NOCA|nr:hypothetical protein LRS1606.219 [Rhodococcus sp. NS1]